MKMVRVKKGVEAKKSAQCSAACPPVKKLRTWPCPKRRRCDGGKTSPVLMAFRAATSVGSRSQPALQDIRQFVAAQQAHVRTVRLAPHQSLASPPHHTAHTPGHLKRRVTCLTPKHQLRHGCSIGGSKRRLCQREDYSAQLADHHTEQVHFLYVPAKGPAGGTDTAARTE